jgi:hypothetical protein
MDVGDRGIARNSEHHRRYERRPPRGYPEDRCRAEVDGRDIVRAAACQPLAAVTSNIGGRCVAVVYVLSLLRARLMVHRTVRCSDAGVGVRGAQADAQRATRNSGDLQGHCRQSEREHVPADGGHRTHRSYANADLLSDTETDSQFRIHRFLDALGA